MKKENKINTGLNGKKITRKAAIKKVGVTALTATTLFFLETKGAPASSGTQPGVPTDTATSAQGLGGRSDGTARPDR